MKFHSDCGEAGHPDHCGAASCLPSARRRLTDEQIVEIRDAHLPNQGESFDCIAFARSVIAASGLDAERSV